MKKARRIRPNLRPTAVFALFSAAALLPGVGGGEILNVYNWSNYIGETTLEDFEREYGIEVNYDVYDTSQIVDAKLMAGNSGYDVVIHAASNAAQLMPIGVFLELDRRRLPHWDKLDPLLLDKFAEFDPGNRYGVPYMWGTTGFAYNRDMLLERMPDAPLHSAELVFDPDIVANFADCGVSLLDSASEVIGMAMVYLGHDANSTVPDHLREVHQLLRAIRPHIKYFHSGRLLLDLPSKEVCVAMSWSGDYSVAARRAAEAGIDITLGYNIPAEGSLVWFDVAYIPADAANVGNAHLFLDFLMRPEVIADISNHTGYGNANLAAHSLVDAHIAADPAIYPDDATLQRLSASRALPPKIERLRSRLWTRVKSGL